MQYQIVIITPDSDNTLMEAVKPFDAMGTLISVNAYRPPPATQQPQPVVTSSRTPGAAPQGVVISGQHQSTSDVKIP